MNKPELKPMWIQLLLKIKHACMEDNDLSMKVTCCGKLAAARYIDELIACVVKLETACEEYFSAMEREEEENQAYRDLLGDYTPDMLKDSERADLAAIVKMWQEADKEDEHHDESTM